MIHGPSTTQHTPLAHRLQPGSGGRRLIRYGKIAILFLFALFFAVYVLIPGNRVFAGRWGWGWSLRTGDYLWQYSLSPRLMTGWLGAMVAAVALTGWWPKRLTPQRTSTQRIVLAAALFAVGYLALAQWTGDPWGEGLLLLVLAVAAVIASYVLLESGKRPPLLARLGDALRRVPLHWTMFIGLAGGCLVGYLAWSRVYFGQPLIIDCQSQIAQARLLLAGLWRLEISQPFRDAIVFPAGVETVPSYSQYPPGHVLLLAAVMKFGLAPQTVNIVATGLMATVTAAVAGRLGGRAAGLVAVILLLGSPFLLAMSGGAMNHATAALLLSVAIWCFLPAEGQTPLNRQTWVLMLGGFCLAWAIATRPLTGAAHAAVWAAVWLALARKVNPQAIRGLWALLGMAPPLGFLLFYNWTTTGHPFVFGYQVSNPALHRLGFVSTSVVSFTPLDALHHLAANFLSLNVMMFGWAIGSWTLLLVWLARTRFSIAERVLLSLIAAQTAAYASYNYHDLIVGPRFLYELMPAFAILAARGLTPLLRRGGRMAGAVWLVLILFAVGGGGEGYLFWSARYERLVLGSTHVQQSVEKIVRGMNRPTVITVSGVDSVMVGRWFGPQAGRQPLWFVLKDRADQARKLPEFEGYAWEELK